MKKLLDWLSNAVPILWGLLWIAIITFGSIAVMIVTIEWFLTLVGVM